MREEQGGVYGVSIGSSVTKYPAPKYTITASWGCNPDNIKKLSQTVLDEMDKIMKNGPTEIDLNKVKETLNRDMETRVKENSWWMSTLTNHYFQGDKILSLEEYKNSVNAITSADIKAIANKYLNLKSYVEVALTPAVKK